VEKGDEVIESHAQRKQGLTRDTQNDRCEDADDAPRPQHRHAADAHPQYYKEDRGGDGEEPGANAAQQSNGVVAHRGPDDGPQEPHPVLDDAELGTAHTLLVRYGDLGQAHALVDGSCAHHRREIEAVGQGVKSLQGFTPEDAHPAGRVDHALAAQHRHQIRPQKVTHTADEWHLALRPRAPRADDEIGIRQRHAAEIGEVLRGIGAVGIEEGQQVATRSVEPRLERSAIPAVGRVPDEAHARAGAGNLRGPIGGAVVHHDQFQVSDPRFDAILPFSIVANLTVSNWASEVCTVRFAN
jgi:hypothetical protein